MKTKIIIVCAFCLMAVTASCGMKGHNSSKIKDHNAKNDRIYGDFGGKPRQLLITWAEDTTGKTASRVEKIRQKLYPK